MPSKEFQSLKSCQKALKKLLDENIKDIIIFGSLAKGKMLPTDIDLVVIGRLDQVKKEEIKKIIPYTDIQTIKNSDIYSPLWPVLISEGFSVMKNQYLHKLQRLEPVVLFKYSLKKFTPVKKVQFTRGLDTILKQTSGKKLVRTAVIIPIDHKSAFEDFLKTWDIYFETRSYNLMPLLRKQDL